MEHLFYSYVLLILIQVTTVTGFYFNISDLVTKLVNQGFNLAALHKKFLKFYHSKLNAWCKHGIDMYQYVIHFFNKVRSFVSEVFHFLLPSNFRRSSMDLFVLLTDYISGLCEHTSNLFYLSLLHSLYS